jgi:hypothetical protein
MATKKQSNRRLEIVITKGMRTKNGFNYREVMGQKKVNVIHTGVGYDTFGSALRAAKRINARLIEPLLIYHRGELVA